MCSNTCISTIVVPNLEFYVLIKTNLTFMHNNVSDAKYDKVRASNNNS